MCIRDRPHTVRHVQSAEFSFELLDRPCLLYTSNRAVGTILLAQARLEDEDGFFATVHEGGEDMESSPWYLLGRTLLLYKLGRRKNARRAARDFAQRCDGGAFFLLNPTYLTPYLPTRPEPQEHWNRCL